MTGYSFQQQQTIHYKTYIKETIVEALRAVFNNHPDPLIKGTRVTVELPTDKVSYPLIIVKYLNRRLLNSGVGNYEWQKITEEGDEPELFQRFKHFLYWGDIELQVLALSSKDRDWVFDALVQTVGMADVESYTDAFLQRVYYSSLDDEPLSKTHFINLRTDEFSETGDQEGPVPWMSEDRLIYRNGLRIPIFGEFYSRERTNTASYGKVQRVDVYPWLDGIDPEPNPHPEDPAPWVGLGDDLEFG